MSDKRLRKLAGQYRGSVLAAAIELGKCATALELAHKLGIEDNVLEEALQPFRGRSYAHIRRSIESQMGLSQYLLDELLP